MTGLSLRELAITYAVGAAAGAAVAVLRLPLPWLLGRSRRAVGGATGGRKVALSMMAAITYPHPATPGAPQHGAHMTRTLAGLVAALIATGARAQTPPDANPSQAALPPAQAAPAPAPAPSEPAKKPKGTFVIGPKSQIIVQGRAWGEVNNVRADEGVGTAPVHNLTRASSNSSYLRIRGERELDHGFKAIAQVEAEVGLDGSGGTPFSGTRNTYVGLSSPYGELTLGKFDSPAKETTIGRDPFVGTGIFGYYNSFTKYRADRRLNNAIGYESPAIQGFTVLAAFSLGEAVVNSTGAVRTNPYTLSGAVHYRNGPLFAGLAYEYRNDCNNPDADAPAAASCSFAALGSDAQPNGHDQVIRFGADYTIKATFTKLAVVYDRIMLQLDAQGALPEQTLSRNSYWASVTQGILSNKHQVVLNVGLASSFSGSNIGVTSKTDVRTYTAAYRYNFDADLMLYVAVAQIFNGDNQSQKFGSNGPSNIGSGAWAAPKGSTVTGFGAGLRYMF